MNSNIIDRLERLPSMFADRLPEPNVAGLRDMAAGGEWRELIDELIAGLARRQPPVTQSERDELATVLEAMGQPTNGLDRLNVTDQS